MAPRSARCGKPVLKDETADSAVQASAISQLVDRALGLDQELDSKLLTSAFITIVCSGNHRQPIRSTFCESNSIATRHPAPAAAMQVRRI